MFRCVHNVKCVHSVLVTKTVFIVHCVYWVCVRVFCTLSSVQSVNMYCLYVNCFCFCTVWSTLSRISLTKALVLWWCDNKKWFVIWFDTLSNPAHTVFILLVQLLKWVINCLKFIFLKICRFLVNSEIKFLPLYLLIFVYWKYFWLTFRLLSDFLYLKKRVFFFIWAS